MRLVWRLDVSSDPAEPQKVDPRGQQLSDQLGWREMVRSDVEGALHLGADWDRFGAALETAAAGRNQRAVIVGPVRPGQAEQTLPLGEAALGIRVGVDKDMPMIESAQQSEVPRHQHAVAEHVARHVADADEGDLAAFDIAPQLAEMALDEFPGAAGGNATRLVVLAGRPARCKSVAEPEPVFFRDRVGKIGETGSALVSRHHQRGIVLVVANDLRARNDVKAAWP